MELIVFIFILVFTGIQNIFKYVKMGVKMVWEKKSHFHLGLIIGYPQTNISTVYTTDPLSFISNQCLKANFYHSLSF